MTTRIGITGAGGRMGRMLLDTIAQTDLDCCLVAALEHPDSAALGGDTGEMLGAPASGVLITASLAEALDTLDVLIDFTVPEATLQHAAMCSAHGVPMVIGTTGFTDAQSDSLAGYAADIAICQASNFSPGVNLTFSLVEAAAKALGNEVDIEIIEAHHRHKIDAPSGTALTLGEKIAAVLGRDFQKVARFSREGHTGERARDTIGFSSIRAGDIVGDHTVMFSSEGETLEITHRASSRTAFARGAVRAACWVVQQGPGRYDMQDVLGAEHR